VTAYGTVQWQQDPTYRQFWSGTASTTPNRVAADAPAALVELVIAR
jgi:hypothetical protein